MFVVYSQCVCAPQQYHNDNHNNNVILRLVLAGISWDWDGTGLGLELALPLPRTDSTGLDSSPTMWTRKRHGKKKKGSFPASVAMTSVIGTRSASFRPGRFSALGRDWEGAHSATYLILRLRPLPHLPYQPTSPHHRCFLPPLTLHRSLHPRQSGFPIQLATGCVPVLQCCVCTGMSVCCKP